MGSIEKLWHVVILDQDVSYRLIYSWLEFALQELTAPVAINRFFYLINQWYIIINEHFINGMTTRRG